MFDQLFGTFRLSNARFAVLVEGCRVQLTGRLCGRCSGRSEAEETNHLRGKGKRIALTLKADRSISSRLRAGESLAMMMKGARGYPETASCF